MCLSKAHFTRDKILFAQNNGIVSLHSSLNIIWTADNLVDPAKTNSKDQNIDSKCKCILLPD